MNSDPFEYLMFGWIIFVICLFSFIGIAYLCDYEGYFCKTVEVSNGVTTINAWCGHNGKLITNSSGTFWHIEGWNFGDFP